jgi:aryl-alcohol dehydrogenase-like predicted oxidoreductase
MHYRYLGRSGLLVSRICLGTMTFGMKDWGCDQETANRIVAEFVNDGGNFFDTADMYSAGVSEEVLGKAIGQQQRDDLVIATKYWFRMGAGPNAKGASRKHVIEAVDASLRRLNTDYIDLYQIHGPDWFTPLEETLRSLDDLVRQGKVRYVGCSNFFAWQIVKANAISERLGLERFVSGQYLYNLVRRDIEREILPACADQGLGMLCWSPLASGFLSGRYARDAEPPAGSRISYRKEIDIPRYFSDAAFDIIDELKAMSGETGKTPSQLALAWLLYDRRVTSVIVGARTVDQFVDALQVAEWNMTGEQHDRLAKSGNFSHGYPMEWVETDLGKNRGMEEFHPDHYRFPTDRR